MLLICFANTIQGTYGPMGGYTAYSYRDGAKGSKAIMSNYTKDGFTVLKNIDLDKPIEDILKDDISYYLYSSNQIHW